MHKQDCTQATNLVEWIRGYILAGQLSFVSSLLKLARPHVGCKIERLNLITLSWQFWSLLSDCV